MYSIYLILDMFTSGFSDIILIILAILAIYFGISVIINNNPVISILYLIGLIASIGCYLISEGFSFLGLSYLIVYVGAVSILFLFTLMLIDIRLSELQSNTSNSIPLTLLIGIFFCYYLFQFLPYNIAISQGGTNRFGALNLKLFNLLNEKVTVTEQGKGLFKQSNSPSESSSSNEKLVTRQKNLFNRISLRNFKPSGQDLSINKHITHSVARPKKNKLATASSKGWDAYLVESNHIGSIGNVMYTIYVLWLLQAVLILLLAMVGAIVITIKPNSSISNDSCSAGDSNGNIIGSALINWGVGKNYLLNIDSRKFSTIKTSLSPSNPGYEAEDKIIYKYEKILNKMDKKYQLKNTLWSSGINPSGGNPSLIAQQISYAILGFFYEGTGPFAFIGAILSYNVIRNICLWKENASSRVNIYIYIYTFLTQTMSGLCQKLILQTFSLFSPILALPYLLLLEDNNNGKNAKTQEDNNSGENAKTQEDNNNEENAKSPEELKQKLSELQEERNNVFQDYRKALHNHDGAKEELSENKIDELENKIDTIIEMLNNIL